MLLAAENAVKQGHYLSRFCLPPQFTRFFLVSEYGMLGPRLHFRRSDQVLSKSLWMVKLLRLCFYVSNADWEGGLIALWFLSSLSGRPSLVD